MAAKVKAWVGGDGIYFGVGGRNFVGIVDYTFLKRRNKVSGSNNGDTLNVVMYTPFPLALTYNTAKVLSDSRVYRNVTNAGAHGQLWASFMI